MADVKEVITPFKTTDKVTLYAPKGAKHYKPGQATSIHPRQKDKFIAFGFAESKDAALLSDAHPAIAADKPKAPVKTPAAAPVKPDVNANPDDKK